MPVNHLHLRAFHEVATCGSFTRAAQVMHVSQPTLSEQVSALERTYGVTLLSRRGRSLALTPLGDQLLEVTTRLAEVDRAAEACLRGGAELSGGRLRLGADAPVHAMPVLARFLQRHPAVSVGVACGNRADVLTDLLEHRTDAALVTDVGDDRRLVSRPLLRDRFVAVVNRRDALAGRKRVRLDELAARRLVLREPGSGTRRAVDVALAKQGLVPTDVLNVDSREAAVVAAAMGVGVAVAAASEIVDDHRVVAVPIAAAGLQSVESIACLAGRERTALVRAVFEAALG